MECLLFVAVRIGVDLSVYMYNVHISAFVYINAGYSIAATSTRKYTE